MPYLLAGGGLVLKQDSPYYEHFYGKLAAWEHFVPVRRDLSDLVDRIKWARENDEKAQQIAINAKNFANENLLPQHVICYHAALFWVSFVANITSLLKFKTVYQIQYLILHKILFQNWSKIIKSEVNVEQNMTRVPQATFTCDCKTQMPKIREDL